MLFAIAILISSTFLRVLCDCWKPRKRRSLKNKQPNPTSPHLRASGNVYSVLENLRTARDIKSYKSSQLSWRPVLIGWKQTLKASLIGWKQKSAHELHHSWPLTRSKTAPEDVLSPSHTWIFLKRERQNTPRVVFSNAAVGEAPYSSRFPRPEPSCKTENSNFFIFAPPFFLGLGGTCSRNERCYANYDAEAFACRENTCQCAPGFYQREYSSCRRKSSGVVVFSTPLRTVWCEGAF